MPERIDFDSGILNFLNLTMRWITALHLTQFAAQRRCEELLPEIIRKLIIASCEDFPKLDLPVGDSVSKPGWDGSCVVSKVGLMVPKGKSLWEMGRNKSYTKKFREDFDKRDRETKSQVKRSSTFIFVTPWKWSRPEKTSFLDKVKSESMWKDVLIYDADNLELWLERCPAVAIWLAQELELFTGEVISAGAYWKDFITLKNHLFDADLILSGRDQQQAQVKTFFEGEPSLIELQASSKAEGAIFAIASMLKAKVSGLESFFSRAVIIENKRALKQVLSLHKGLYVIFFDAESEVDFSGPVNGNHVVSIVNFLFRLNDSGISLPIPKLNAFAQGLEKLGYTHQDTYVLAEKCGRSVIVLRRMLTDRAGRTSWSLAPSVIELLPLFFVQRLDDEFIGDREIIGKLFPGGYEQYKVIMKRWSLLEDRPVSQTLNHWQIVSAYDLLFVLGKYITEEDLGVFASVLKEVTQEINPALELERKQRFAAALYDKKSKYSSRLQKGMMETLALVAVKGKEAGIHTSFELSNWADQMVADLLKSPELEHWQTIESRIDLLAETSPSAFLSAVESMVKHYPDRVTELFNDSDFDFFSPIYFTRILYALESIAWDSRYLGRVSLLLAELCKLDKGKITANRAFASLKAVFLWWMPQTYASIDQRKQVLKMLMTKKPELALRLLKHLSPHVSNVGHYSRKPIWRLRDEFEQRIKNGVYLEGLDFTCSALIEIAGKDSLHWKTVLKLADDYNGEMRTRILDAGLSVDFDGEGKDELRRSLKELIRIHSESTRGTAWNLNKADLQKLRLIYDGLISNDVERYGWYFDVEALENRRTTKMSYDEIAELSRKKRKDAMQLMLASSDLAVVLVMASGAKYPYYVGVALAGTEGVNEDLIFVHLNQGGNLESVFKGYVMESHQQFGLSWVTERIAMYQQVYPVDVLVHFYLSIEASAELWLHLDRGIPEMKDLYWTKVNQKYHPWFHRDHHESFVTRLVQYGRFATAVNSIYDIGRVSPQLLIEVMQGYMSKANTEHEVKIHSGSYIFGKIMKRLIDCGTDKQVLAGLQWQYFQALDQERNPELVAVLYDELNNNPAQFAQLVYFKWKPDEGDFEEDFAKEGKESVMDRGQNANEVLERWQRLPGMNEDGSCDFVVLKNYFSHALICCEEKNRRKRGMYELGERLGRGEFVTSKWPHPQVCEIIDFYDNEELSKGFYMGYSNRGGVRVTSGGYNKQYAAKKIAYLREAAERLELSFPVTAKVVNEIADSKVAWDAYEAKRAAQDDD